MAMRATDADVPDTHTRDRDRDQEQHRERDTPDTPRVGETERATMTADTDTGDKDGDGPGLEAAVADTRAWTTAETAPAPTTEAATAAETATGAGQDTTDVDSGTRATKPDTKTLPVSPSESPSPPHVPPKDDVRVHVPVEVEGSNQVADSVASNDASNDASNEPEGGKGAAGDEVDGMERKATVASEPELGGSSAAPAPASPSSPPSPAAPAAAPSTSSPTTTTTTATSPTRSVPKIITSPVDEPAPPLARSSSPPSPTSAGAAPRSASPASPSTPTSPSSPAPAPASASASASPASASTTSAPPSPTPAAAASGSAELSVARPPRRSSLMGMHPKSMLTPAPARALSPPAAPAKPPPQATRVAADLEEFDPFATPAPAPVPAVPPKDRGGAGSSGQGTPGGRAGTGGPRGQGGQGGDGGQGGRPPRSQTPQRSQTPPGAPGQLAPPVGGHRRSSSRSDDEPQFNFAGFLRDLRTKPAEPVARYLKSFLTNFSRKPFTVNEQIKLIRDFLAFIGDKMRNVEPWKSQSAAEFDNALEAMEKLVMNRLYPYTFTPQLTGKTTITTDDLERDAVFAQRVRLFTWVQEKHLDVPEGEQSAGFLTFAEQELLKMNHYKAPRDKMICILNCCKVIFGLIRHTQGNEAGADAFVPILIFVVLRANPENMLSNVEYINRFRNPEKLMGEAGYYLSSLQGAIAFIETMDASSLSNITQEEFEANVEQAIRELPSSPTSPRVESAPPGSLLGPPAATGAGAAQSDMSPFATSPGEEPARPLTMPATAAALDGTKRFFQRTGDAAKEAVSRPLSAIGKILETMQAAAESESGEDDSEDERERERWAQKHGAPKNQAQGHARSSSQAQPPSRLLAQLGLSPGGSESVTPTARTPTPDTAAYHAHMQAQQAAMFQQQQQQQQTPPPPPAYAYPGQYATAASGQYSPQDGTSPSAPGPMTPAQLQQYQQHQQFYAQQLAAQQQMQATQQQLHQQQMATTLEASHEAYAREQARLANVTTLQQMFPALGEEIVDSVLYSCGDDLGLAIDRLLEM